jgi:hypothetical protein
VERKGPSAEGSRKSILLSSLRAISNQILPFLRRRWCRPSPPQNGAAGEGFPSEARWHGRSAPHVVPASLDLADGRAHDILCFFFWERTNNEPVHVQNFFIFNLSRFSKNKWSNQNFRQMYIWRRGPLHLAYDVRGDANGRQYWPVGSGSCRRGHWRQEP